MKAIRKSITFVAQDKGEALLAEPIAEEARRRGYAVTISGSMFAKDDIVFYCQHDCFPRGNSRLSCVMLHDLGQQHGLWPNIWVKENWNVFDLGFLPNREWERMWIAASKYFFARPRIGCFMAGWPKADVLNGEDFYRQARALAERIHLDSGKKTVLYAPSWEYGNRQIEFIDSMKTLGVNMLIKQYPWDEKMFPSQYAIIREMEAVCAGMKDVFILNPAESIFTAIVLADVLVSEESSTLLENMLVGKPSVAVTDWLVPDMDPPRLPVVPYEFVVKTEKAQLSETVGRVLADYDKYAGEARQYRDNNFPLVGGTARMMMDVIDIYVAPPVAAVHSLTAMKDMPIPRELLKKYKYWHRMKNKSYILNKYIRGERPNKIMSALYRIYKNVRGLMKK